MERDILSLSKRRHSVIEWTGKKLPFDGLCNATTFTQPLSLQCEDVVHNTESCGEARDESHYDALTAEKTGKKGFEIEKGTGSKPVRNSKYHCLFCGKSFQWRSHWLAHERIHTGERPFKCDICSKAFTRSDGLKCHELTHDHEKKETSCQLNQNTSTHNVLYINKNASYRQKKQDMNDEGQKGAKGLKCGTCNRLFNRPSALDIHSRVHTGVKPYPCNICAKPFSIYGNLRRHLLIHTGERPYTCSKCSISFNNSSHLKRHVKNKHPPTSLGLKLNIKYS